ncbi:MAG TPA: triose-phosphate isomerase [Lentisphaeria bacterium]|nr:triose-phosphate isomerase [Lentisphaerota bacterium]OQC15755.1 MAG: Bifunctional PGK [Lentisphaerae bacterium ADurb.Bin082]HPY89754.1 triose-phosphate isomerase [Lentisphaeria bacterium]HQC52778.1 triose-phosphate isomerase [Lentisphaeria bacterium]HQL88001.1 triose-phosphate isomerase [Lentisphaeria bacterium]
MSRCKVIAGNWKMNLDAAQGVELVEKLKSEFSGCASCCSCDRGPEVVVCPPFTTLPAVVAAAKGSRLKVGAQNIHWAEKGAFTGEISGAMLTTAGATHVIVGHSERRQYFGETDETVNKRLQAGLANGLTVIVCVGEQLLERVDGTTKAVVERQVRAALAGVDAAAMSKVIIAYEPVWAIGTGKVATTVEAQEVHAFIRALLKQIFVGSNVAETTRILYGGSMNPDNAAGLLAQKDIDGGLIGGASLKADQFAALIRAAH